MPANIILNARGLTTSPNNLIQNDGGLSIASNVIIKRDNIIESRRGYKLFGEELGTGTDRAKQIMSYKQRLLVHYAEKLAFQDGVNNNGTDNFTDFAGSYEETQDGLRIKSIESNGNFYFTTSEGIKKISAATSDGLSSDTGFITQAGGIKALDLTTRVKYEAGNQTGFLPADSAVAYRVVWGTKDANNNLILGTPSQRQEVFNSLLTLTLQDYMNVLGALDKLNASGSVIKDGNYVSTLELPITASATELYNNLIALSTKIDTDIQYADNNGSLSADPPFELDTVAISAGVCTVTFINVNPGAKVSQYFASGSKVYLAGTYTVGTSGSINGLQTIASIDDTTNSFTFNTSAVGTVTLAGDSVIQSGAFRSISQPTAPSTPATNANLEELQNYLDEIIQTLQNLSTELLVANDTGSGVNLNIDAAACSITTGTATITFSSGDPRLYLIAGNYIFLSGFTPTTGTVNGLQTIVSVTATTLTFTTTATGTIAVAADAFINKIIHFSNALATSYIDTLDITTTATVILNITIPEDVTEDYFYQIYRSSIVTADGADVLTDLTPSDELQLVFEAFPTEAELEAGEIEVEDITPDAFRGANLYTNAATGEGIAQANDIPPFAKDINRFKSTIFFANTKTRHRLSLNLLGVTQMIEDYNNSITPQVVITTEDVSNTYNFVTGIQEITNVDTVADVANSLDGKYFYINSANDNTLYYVWYSTSGGTAVDPAISGRTGIRVNIATGATAAQVATATRDTIVVHNADFTATITSPTDVVRITNTEAGYTTDASDAGATGFTFTYTQGRGERVSQETTLLTMPAGSTFTTSGSGNYFILNSAFNRHQYYIWYQVNSSVDPAPANKTGIQVSILTGDTAAQVATKTATALASFFSAEANSTQVTVINLDFGPAIDGTTGTMPGGFTLSVTTQGALEVLLSSVTSPSVAVDETARSFVRVINKNRSDAVNAFYLSGSQDVPGKMFFEAKDLQTTTFYVLGNNDNTGTSFNPDISPAFTGISNTAANPTVVTATSHGLVNGDSVVIVASNSTPYIDGEYPITRISANTFSIPVNVTSSGNQGAIIKAGSGIFSSNEEKKNRIYYSKLMQPEAVPLVNFFDVGAEDKAILRIFPLRDSLFVFKEDGLYRVSGELAPFTLALFDSSCILIAADSVDVCNNIVFSWTTQGIVPVTEGGVSDPVSRDIDDQILRLASANYTNFPTATWGKGYESDNSYKVWTVKETTDDVATIAYRWSTLTKGWTTYDKTNTCGITNPVDDKEYLGAGDTNSVEVERKDFSRTDYADREFTLTLSDNSYFNDRLQFSNVINSDVGDVLVQFQTISVYDYNSLLKKLDIDPGINDSDYLADLEIAGGANMRTALTSLATKLDADLGVSATDYAASIANLSGSISSFSIANPTVVTDAAHGLETGRYITISGVTGSVPDVNGDWIVTKIDANTFTIPVNVITPGTGGVWTTLISDFQDIQGCYNIIMRKLNTDSGVGFTNYEEIETTTEIEAVVNEVDQDTDILTLSDTLDFILGPITSYKAISTEFEYQPNTMGDTLGLKQCREATMMFQNKAFTRARMGFATDLLPEIIEVEFNGDGNGIFGMNTFGAGFFGGGSNSAPFRTYVPKQCQRCRFMLVSFAHNIAREQWAVYGTALVAEVGESSRAYR